MKFLMRIATPFTLVMSFALSTQANWGTGMYGGMQACPYPHSAAAGSSSYLDEVKEAQAAIKEAEKQLRAKKSEKKRLEKTMERSRRDVEEVVAEDFTEFMFEHIENSVSCKEYKGMAGSEEFIAQGSEGDAAVQAPSTREVRAFSIQEWTRLCDSNKNGSVNAVVCDGPRFRQTEKGRATSQDCKKGLTEYRKNYAQTGKLQREIEGLENLIRRSKDDIQDAKQNYADEQRERQREQLEGGVCVDCIAQGSGYVYQKPETDWGSVVGNIGLGLAATYMGYQTNKMVANANANIGWPTQPYPAWGYGFPFLAQGIGQAIGGGSGIYGAIGGGIGAGAFGCAGMNGGVGGMAGPYGGMNAGGMWGNPYGMAGMGGLGGGLGGGIYLPGMGPWGMAGPWGMGGPYPGAMGYPMMGGAMGMPMGAMVSGGIGAVMGMQMGGMMGMPMGAMAGGMMGMPMGAMAGGMMGMPMGAMASGGIGGVLGMPMGGMAGGMMGMPMGAMAGGMMGMPMGGMMGMPMGAMASGGIGGVLGMPMGGMAGGMMGMPMGGMAGGMMGMPMGGMTGGMMGMPMGGMSGGLGAMQMQQQIMQMQMQQYQQYIQQQQSYMQQQMQRQQVVASLQQELYGLLYRIQQVQYGVGGSVGGTIGGGIGIGGGVGGGIGGGVITPLPGSVGGGGTISPIPGGSGTAPIPSPR